MDGKKKQKVIYWDNFVDEPIREEDRDAIAPPERYTEVYENPEDGWYIETFLVQKWDGSGDGELQIAISAEIWMDCPQYVATIRKNRCDENACNPVYMKRWGVPKHHYEKILKRVYW